MERKTSKINSKLFIPEKTFIVMTEDSEKLRKLVKEYSDNLAKLGHDLSKIQFRYKIIENATKEYWKDRIEKFKRYAEKGIEYYFQAHALINLVDKEKSGLFLLSISKLRQLELNQEKIMMEVMQNPSVIKSKDKQQSKWSKDLREQLVNASNKCLDHETGMNRVFRECYESKLKKILE
jgi:argininosuccinate lyase